MRTKTEKIRNAVKSRKPAKTETAKSTRVTLDSLTLDLACEGKHTLKDIHSKVCKAFPKHDEDVLLSTTRRRLHGHLQKTRNVTIVKNDSGVYSVPAKKTHTRKQKTA